MLRIPTPRLLPATIASLAVLLVLKCGILAQAALTDGARLDSAMVAVANAASTERGPEKTPEHEQPAGKTPPPPVPPKTVATPPSVPVPEGPPPVSDSERALLQDLRTRRKELDARADTVATRESVLTATEQKLSGRVTELQTLQKQLETLDAAQKQKQDAGWQGLVKVYETMKPKDAAAIFNELSMPVLLQVVDRMKDSKTAAIMASMNPDRARDVTTELAQMRTGRNTGQQSAATPKANPAGG